MVALSKSSRRYPRGQCNAKLLKPMSVDGSAEPIRESFGRDQLGYDKPARLPILGEYERGFRTQVDEKGIVVLIGLNVLSLCDDGPLLCQRSLSEFLL